MAIAIFGRATCSVILVMRAIGGICASPVLRATIDQGTVLIVPSATVMEIPTCVKTSQENALDVGTTQQGLTVIDVHMDM